MNEKDLFNMYAMKIMEVYLADYLSRASRGSVESFLISAVQDVKVIAEAFVKEFGAKILDKKPVPVEKPKGPVGTTGPISGSDL